MAFCLCLLCSAADAQKITGIIADLETGRPLGDVSIRNIHMGTAIHTDTSGRFTMEVAADQLIEFYAPGYKMEKVRVPQGMIPPYFKIFLKKTAIEQQDYLAKSRDWKQDSMRTYALYQHELEFPKMSTLDMINHPFSALSKRNRQIWAFQDEYAMLEKEKFIDYVFNEKLVGEMTGMQGDSARAYLRMFRPKYEQLRRMSEYDFYNYVTRTVAMFREGYDPKHPPGRNPR